MKSRRAAALACASRSADEFQFSYMANRVDALQGLVYVVVDASLLGAGLSDQVEQGSANFVPVAGLGIDISNYSDSRRAQLSPSMNGRV